MVFRPWKVAAVYPRLSWTGMTTPRTDRGCGAIMPKTVEAKGEGKRLGPWGWIGLPCQAAK